MTAFISMIVATILGSLYPLAAVFGIEQFDPFAFVFLASLISFLSSLFFVYGWVLRQGTKDRVVEAINMIREEHYILILITGACTTMCHIFFLLSLGLMSKAGAAIIFETWPILTMFLAPLLIQKVWIKLRVVHYFLSLFCLIGIILIGLSDQSHLSKIPLESVAAFDLMLQQLNFEALLGILLAFLGSITCTLSAIYRGEISRLWEETLPNGLLRVSISECLTRLVGLPFAILCYLFLGEPTQLNLTTLLAVSFIGVFTFTGVNILYTFALMKSPSSSINIMWYLQPVLAVIWLQLMGLSPITSLILTGMILIVFSNVILPFTLRDKSAKPA